MKFKSITITSLACLSLLSGCAEYDLKEAPGYQFTKEQPIRLNVANFRIINTPIGTEAQTTKNLRLALEAWGNSRFVPFGREKKAILIVEDAKLLTHQEEYDGEIRVKLEILDDRGFVVGSAHAAVVRTLKLPVDLSLEERAGQLKRFQEELINDIDKQMTKELIQHLPTYISTWMS